MKANTNKMKIGNSAVAGLAGGAVIGSPFGFPIAIVTSIVGALIGAFTQSKINDSRDHLPEQKNNHKRQEEATVG